jgi:hypothetical protein
LVPFSPAGLWVLSPWQWHFHVLVLQVKDPTALALFPMVMVLTALALPPLVMEFTVVHLMVVLWLFQTSSILSIPLFCLCPSLLVASFF